MTVNSYNNIALALMLGGIAALFCVSNEAYSGAGFVIDLNRSPLQHLFAAMIEGSDIADKAGAAFQSTLIAFLFACWGAFAQHRKVGRRLKRSARKVAKNYRLHRRARQRLNLRHNPAG